MTPRMAPGYSEADVRIDVGSARLAGMLSLPPSPCGIVVFAHGSGSSRNSPRNTFVARTLIAANLGTLLFDLLTLDEDRGPARRFDIGFLSNRLAGATQWLRADAALATLPLGYFGASTGAAAALVTAARPGANVGAIVSRGGRPDLAGPEALVGVEAATLLIVGGDDVEVVELNRRALGCLRCEKALRIVPGATHLFEEPGMLDAVAAHAREWFVRFLCGPP